MYDGGPSGWAQFLDARLDQAYNEDVLPPRSDQSIGSTSTWLESKNMTLMHHKVYWCKKHLATPDKVKDSWPVWLPLYIINIVRQPCSIKDMY